MRENIFLFGEPLCSSWTDSSLFSIVFNASDEFLAEELTYKGLFGFVQTHCEECDC